MPCSFGPLDPLGDTDFGIGEAVRQRHTRPIETGRERLDLTDGETGSDHSGSDGAAEFPSDAVEPAAVSSNSRSAPT
jgi:hypothetical protein